MIFLASPSLDYGGRSECLRLWYQNPRELIQAKPPNLMVQILIPGGVQYQQDASPNPSRDIFLIELQGSIETDDPNGLKGAIIGNLQFKVQLTRFHARRLTQTAYTHIDHWTSSVGRKMCRFDQATRVDSKRDGRIVCLDAVSVDRCSTTNAQEF
jgi:hypothetical protein